MTESENVERLRVTLDELRLINNVIHSISQVRESNHMMSIIIGELIRATGAEEGIISTVSRMKPDELNTLIRKSDSTPGNVPFVISDSIAGWVLKHRTMLKVDDLDTDTRFLDINSDNGRFKSVICMPLFARSEIIGLVTLIRSAGRGAFDDDQCRVAGILASQSAHVLSNAQLTEELARKNELLTMSYERLNEENATLKLEVNSRFGFENIIGSSKAMKQVFVMASKFATNDSPVLISGETGTGKELIARAIHANSARRLKSFIIKNCGIKTETLLESELFGHVKGAFTGADRDKPGLFREADNGTVFLDEIGDAPLSTQAAILRVIQSGEIRAVGASKSERVNVRVLSATNKNLQDEIKAGRFREDLYYRLNTFMIELPPLRDRRDDIPLLVDYLLKKLRVKSGNAELSVSAEALKVLLQYSWPGNVRQLEHELERASVVSSPSSMIEPADLSPELIDATSGLPELESTKGELRLAVEKLERNMIVAALGEHKGNIVHTSQALGLTRKGLKDKMARYGIGGDAD